MRTKKLFLKLFLTAFFMSMFLPKDALAAVSGQTELNIEKGNIYIGDKIGYYTDDLADVTSDSVTSEVASNSRGYTISGTVSGKKTITIDVSGALNLSFQNLDLNSNCQIHIKRGDVTLALYDKPTYLTSTERDTIVLDNGSSLTIQGSGSLSVTSNTYAIKGNTNLPKFSVQSGLVTLNRGTQHPLTSDLNVQVSGGTLSCLSGGNNTELGSNEIVITGGVVNAVGVAKIDYEAETITNIPDGAGVSVGTLGNFTNEVKSGTLKIKESWYSETVLINRQKLTIKSRTKKSSGAKWVRDETYLQEKDGSLTNINSSTMRYIRTDQKVKSMAELAKLVGEDRLTEKWQNFSSAPTPEDLEPGYYYIQVKGDNSSQTFASDPTSSELQIKAGKRLEIEPLTLNGDFGYVPDDVSENLSIKNYGSDDLTITSIKWSNNPDNIFALPSLPPEPISGRKPPSNASVYNAIKITPKANLSANNDGYKANLTISYTINGANAGSVSADITFKVSKAKQSSPNGLTVTDTTYNSATLSVTPNPDNPNKEEGMGIEYSYSEDGTWDNKAATDKPTITGLKPGTPYTFLARYKETANYGASDFVEATGTTEAAAEVDYEYQKLKFAYREREYTVAVGDGKPQAYPAGTEKIDIPDEWCGKTITVTDVKKNASQTIALPAIGKAPTPKAVDEQVIGDNGQITNVSDKMQYRKKITKNGWEKTWSECRGKTVENVEPGDYQVRYKATTSAFASAIATITVHKGPSIDVQLAGNDFDKIPYGTSVSGKIVIQNRDTVPVTLEGITLSAQDFVITEGDKSLAPNAYVEWSIQPKEKLDVGTYESEIIVSYDDGQVLPDDPAPDDNEGEDENNSGDENKNPDDTEDTKPDIDNNNPEQQSIDAKAVGESQEITASDASNIRTHSVDVKATIVKAPQPEVPPVPAEKSKTATSITLESIPDNATTGAKVQYSRDGGRTWQDSPTFTGLSPNREYTFVARYGETDNYEPSEPCEGEVAISTLESKGSNEDDTNNNGVTSKDNNSGTNGNGSGSNSATNGNGTNGTGSGNNSGTNGNGTNGNGSGSNSGTNNNGTNGSSSNGVLSSAKTGDLNNIQLWAALMIGSYLSCAIIIKNRLKKSNS